MLGVLGIDAALDRRASRRRRLDDPLAHRDPELLGDQVASEAHLGHRMLDLQARVSLQKVELAAVDQELHRTRVAIAGHARDFQRRLDHPVAQALVESRRRDSSMTF